MRAGEYFTHSFLCTGLRKKYKQPGLRQSEKKNYGFSSRNFLYAASSPAPYSTVFFVGT